MKEDFLIESNHQIENVENVVNDTEDILETTISDQHASGEGLEIDVQESSYGRKVSQEETLENVNLEVSLSTYEIIDDNTEICGVSLKGRQHTVDNDPCDGNVFSEGGYFYKTKGRNVYLGNAAGGTEQ